VAYTGGAGGATAAGTGGAGGNASLTGGAGGADSGAGTGGNGGNIVLTPGAAGSSVGGTAGVAGNIRLVGTVAVQQGNVTAKTTDATLTIAELLTGILTGTHAAGATQTYTLPTGTLTDAALRFSANDAFDWVLINLSAAAVDTVTVAAGANHTVVGNMIVQSSHSTTGGIYGNSGQFRTRKTGANTYVTYRIA
jgi:hypothetical protein